MFRFTGKNCEIKLAPCSPNPCANNGICVLKENTYTCFCAQGFVGTHCDNVYAVNPCQPDPCIHGQCIQQGSM